MASITLEITSEQWTEAKSAMNSLLSKLENIPDKSIREDILTVNALLFPKRNSISSKLNDLTADDLASMMDEIQDEVKQSDPSDNTSSNPITTLSVSIPLLFFITAVMVHPGACASGKKGTILTNRP